ncbi:MAG: hypothetical protein ACYCUG_16415, partial [Acidimicrobiales bacterium]
RADGARRRPPILRRPEAPTAGAAWRRGGSAAPLAAATVPAPAREQVERRHLELVEPRRRVADARRRARLLLAGISALAVVTVFGLVALHVVSAEKQFQIDRLAAQEQRLQNTYEVLRLQVDGLDTPQRILTEAQRLGMVQPQSVTFVRVPGGPTAGSGGAPSGPSDWAKMKAVLAGNP